MSGDNFTDGIPKFRSILGDITNRSVKRGFSSISDNVGFNSKEEASYRFTKQVCLGENSIQENPKTPQFEPNPNTSSTCGGETDTSKEGLVPVNEKVSEVIERFDLSDSDDRLDQGEGIKQARGTLNDSCRNDSKDLGVGRLASSEGGCVEWLRLPKSSSQGFRSFELERCVGLKNDGSNLNAGADMLKACSCSFCLKAAYIWSDLHYQDTKGRIAVLKRSQKEASILVQKSCSGKETDIQNLGNPNKSSKLESDLTSQWRSLFLNMEDIFVHESNQLIANFQYHERTCNILYDNAQIEFVLQQASYIQLKDLRDNCKMDLERITGMPSER
ncbi:Kielin/chordin-like protein [Gossypium australe]|uniref:Kielin/chordin-like protein n=1 Tax=Gossypium australe TaxID=47621 RepID=A0A5B6W1Y0_9ROSI|nr:Kielin/chordin-like protein [Gossypium australe]